MDEKKWYYAKDNESVGPISELTLQQMLLDGRITVFTYIWTEGLQDWVHLKDVMGIADADPSAIPKAVIVEPVVPQVRPWIRYLARATDLLLFSIFIGAVFSVVLPNIQHVSVWLVNILVFLMYIPVEATLLASAGTTPGKFLCGVKLRTSDGHKLSYSQALKRSFNVSLEGLALGIPILSIITLITSYQSLERHKITKWDKVGSFRVTHQRIGTFRAMSMVFFFLAVVSLSFLSNLLVHG